MTLVEVVEKQLTAFNSKDFNAFIAMFSEDVRVYDMPDAAPKLSGKEAFAAAYAKALSNPAMRVEILSRLVVGNKVVDHERVHGLKAERYDVVAIYEVGQDLIRAMWFFKSE